MSEPTSESESTLPVLLSTPAAGPSRPGLTAADLRGVIVPVITPFDPGGAVDVATLRFLIEGLIAEGVHGLVLAGTTGESPTVSWDEIERLLPAVIAAVRGRVPLLVGTGCNDTAASVQRTRRARALGADGAFAVCPYYNRPAPAGVIAHYQAIAAVGLPTVAYHIPYRTGLSLDRETLEAILAIPGIIALKESSGGVGNIAYLATRPGAALLCGEDALFLAALEAGAAGAIIASANLLPRGFVAVHDAFVAGDLERARERFAALVPLIELLFAEPSPAPLKWALQRLGKIPAATLRLPMTPITPALEARLAAALSPPPSAAEIEALCAGFFACTLPASAWNHRAHVTVGTTLVHRHGPERALTEMRGGILRLNAAHGTPETPTRGYHETITRASLELIAGQLAARPGASLQEHVAFVLASPLGNKDALLGYYSRERLFSPQARASWHPPDLRGF